MSVSQEAQRKPSAPELRTRLAWTLGPVAAFCALGHIPLIGLDHRVLAELIHRGYGGSGVASVMTSMGAVRFLSIGMPGLSYLPVCVGLVLLARSASPRFKARLDAGGGWGGVMTWAARLTVIATVLVSWSRLSFLAAGGGAVTLVRDNGLLTYYLPNLAAVAAGTAIALWLARVMSGRGLCDGFLALLAVQSLFRVLVTGADLPMLIRSGELGFADLLPGTVGILAVVALTGAAVLGTRRIQLYRSAAQASSDAWPHGLILPVAPATVWALLSAVALCGVIPERTQLFGFVLQGWWFSGTGFTRLLAQFAVFALLVPRANAATLDPDDMAAELIRRGARIPGVRPGERTADRIRAIQRRLTGASLILLGAAAMADAVVGLLWRRLFHTTSGSAPGTWVLIAAATWMAWKSAKETIRLAAGPAALQP